MKICLTYLLTWCCVFCLQAQRPETEQTKAAYLQAQKMLGQSFSAYFYPSYASVHRLTEDQFVNQIDSVRAEFTDLLGRYRTRLDEAYVAAQRREIKFYFDRLLIEYPNNHETYARSGPLQYPLIERISTQNLAELNEPALLADEDVHAYASSFLDYRMTREMEKKIYDGRYNKYLDARWNLISTYFHNMQCRNFWRFDALMNHMDHNGIKGINRLFDEFTSTCPDTAYVDKLRAAYQQHQQRIADHLVREYKRIGNYGLDIHIFLPEEAKKEGASCDKRPVMVYFHGGSWSEGEPGWHFDACRRYAQQGWIACAVEYRIYGKQGTLPFAAVKDARSAIRWLREHGNEFNADTGRIVATGNSAGGHLVLACALADRWNERSDRLTYSPVPDVLLVTSGVYDLTDDHTAWIRKNPEHADLARQLSPIHLVGASMPPLLMIHGGDDRNAPYASAAAFAEQATISGARPVFKTIAGAGHFIFTDPNQLSRINTWRRDFLLELGFPNNSGE